MTTEQKTRLPKTAFIWGLGALSSLFFSSAALAASGAIWTTLGSGATVNANVYDAKEDVYLNGGPKGGGGGLTDGLYYFQVTDPAAKVLLSTDPIACRRVTVANGLIAGSFGNCHANGSVLANGTTPVQLFPYNDTPNTGGEYKVWLTAVGAYDLVKCESNFGFCESSTKTDNFKVRSGPAFVIACKFNDMNGNGVQDAGDTIITHWPITATGVDGGTVPLQTDDTGCVSFTVTNFPATVTITEGFQGLDWVQTSPTDGARARSGSTPAYSVTGGVVTTSDLKGNDVLDIDFGNHNPDCAAAGKCEPPPCILRGECEEFPGLLVTKNAHPTYKVTWGIDKTVDQSRIETGSMSAVANYTVVVTHDGGTGFVVNGTIEVSNPTIADAVGVNVTDAVDNATGLDDACVVTGGTNITVKAGEKNVLPYTCTYASLPADGINTATATWAGGLGSSTGTAEVKFANAVVVDGTVNITDTLAGTLGSLSKDDPSPKTYTYPITLTGTSGTCVVRPNTATFTSTAPANPSAPTTGSDPADVNLCVGADLVVTKTATPTFRRVYSWSILKTVDTPRIVGGGTANYAIKVTQTGVADDSWVVTGSISVSNPNDWQSVGFNVADAINNGGLCTVTGGSGTLAAGASATASYTCTYTVAPSPASFINTATASVTSGVTPNATASGTASGVFANPTLVNKTVTAIDVMNGNTVTLGTLTGNDAMPFASQTFTFSATFTPPI